MNFKKDINNYKGRVANVVSKKRKLLRKEEVELNEINENYNKLVWEFQMHLWTIDWDKEDEDNNPFKQFDDAWRMFCEHWNKQKTHMIKANSEAFTEWALDNTKTNKNDKPIFITGDKLTHLRWSL